MAGTGVSPFETPLAYDQLAMFTLTGGAWTWMETEVDLEGDLENEWDTKKAGGQDGARAADKGYKLWEPKLTWVLWNEDHWKAYQDMLDAIRPRPGKAPKPVIGITHPLAALAGIILFQVKKVPTLKHLAVDQWEASLELLEYGAAPKPVKKASSAKTLEEQEAELYAKDPFILQQYGASHKPTAPPKPSTSIKPPPRKK